MFICEDIRNKSKENCRHYLSLTYHYFLTCPVVFLLVVVESFHFSLLSSGVPTIPTSLHHAIHWNPNLFPQLLVDFSPCVSTSNSRTSNHTSDSVSLNFPHPNPNKTCYWSCLPFCDLWPSRIILTHLTHLPFSSSTHLSTPPVLVKYMQWNSHLTREFIYLKPSMTLFALQNELQNSW